MNGMIPEKLVEFKVYSDSNDLLGVSDIELPTLEFMTETIKGAGIAGEVDSPTVGHFSSMEIKMTWRTLHRKLFKLAGNRTKVLDCRGAQQNIDRSTGEYKIDKVRVIIKGMPKKVGLGKFETASVVGSSTVLEAIYLKITVNDKTVVEIDKYNSIANIGGTDFLQEVRDALGI